MAGPLHRARPHDLGGTNLRSRSSRPALSWNGRASTRAPGALRRIRDCTRPPPNHLLSIALTPEWLLLAAAMFCRRSVRASCCAVRLGVSSLHALIAISITQALRGATEARYLLRARDLHAARQSARLRAHFPHAPDATRRAALGTAEARADAVAAPTAAPAGVRARAARRRYGARSGAQPQDWLTDVSRRTGEGRRHRRSGGDYDEWDLRVRGGLLAGARLVMAVEDHEGGKQNVHFRTSFSASRLAAGVGRQPRWPRR